MNLLKKVRKKCDDAEEMFNQQTKDECYDRYKKLCYRYLVLEALLGLLLELLFSHFVLDPLIFR